MKTFILAITLVSFNAHAMDLDFNSGKQTHNYVGEYARIYQSMGRDSRESGQLELDRQRVELERQRLEIARQRLELDRQRQQKMYNYQ